MFQGIVTDATTAANAMVSRLVARISVAMVFVVALGFAIAGSAIWLVDRYGGRDACLILAAAFVVVGLIISIVMRSPANAEAAATITPAETKAAEAVSETVTAAAQQLPLALVGTLLTLPGGPSSILSAARVLVRNWPLVALVGGSGFLITKTASEDTRVPSNGLDTSEAAAGWERRSTRSDAVPPYI